MSDSTCAHCGAPFLPTKPNRRFCSVECRTAVNRAETKAKRQAARILTLECPGCGVTFDRVGRQLFCSRQCATRIETRARLGLASPPREATCWWCEKPFNRLDGRELYCSSECAHFVKSLWNLGRYGITREDYRATWREQRGLCAICGQPERSKRNRLLCVDHDHVTGHFRGLLCSHCNRGLGLLKDDPKVVASALRYVKAGRQPRLFTT